MTFRNEKLANKMYKTHESAEKERQSAARAGESAAFEGVHSRRSGTTRIPFANPMKANDVEMTKFIMESKGVIG